MDLEISSTLQCFNCARHFMQCPCNDLSHGEDMQFAIRQPATGTVRQHVDFWASYVEFHPACGHVAASRFVQDQFDKGMLHFMQTAKPRLVEQWNMYTQKPEFEELLPRLKNWYTKEQLIRVGNEAMESFFSGRWIEMNSLGITIFMNALGASPLVPEDPANKDLFEVSATAQFICKIITMISLKPGYTMVAPGLDPRLKSMAVFEPILDFP